MSTDYTVTHTLYSMHTCPHRCVHAHKPTRTHIHRAHTTTCTPAPIRRPPEWSASQKTLLLITVLASAFSSGCPCRSWGVSGANTQGIISLSDVVYLLLPFLPSSLFGVSPINCGDTNTQKVPNFGAHSFSFFPSRSAGRQRPHPCRGSQL
jgi:hypothetical protein